MAMFEQRLSKKSLSAVLLSGLICVAFVELRAQEQKFDRYTFKLPEGYTRKEGRTFVDFLKYNDLKTSYAEITFYKTRPGTADVKKEFTNDWIELVKKKRGVEVPRISGEEEENGWKTVFGSAQVNAKEGKYIQTIITFAAKGMVMSISIRSTDNSFAAEVQEILGSVVIEKP